jgi:hypothetical protein
MRSARNIAWKILARIAVPLRGDINVRNDMCKQLNRTSDVAWVRPYMPLKP